MERECELMATMCSPGDSSGGSDSVSMSDISALISAAFLKTAFRSFTTLLMSFASLSFLVYLVICHLTGVLLSPHD